MYPSRAQGLSAGLSLDYSLLKGYVTNQPDVPFYSKEVTAPFPSLGGYLDYALSNRWSIASSLNVGYIKAHNSNESGFAISELFIGPQYVRTFSNRMRIDFATGPVILFAFTFDSNREKEFCWGALARTRFGYYISNDDFVFAGVKGGFGIEKWREYRYNCLTTDISLGIMHSF